jgi:hypothetical protein
MHQAIMNRKYNARLVKLLFFTISNFFLGSFFVPTYGQLIDNFGDGNLQDPTWAGDISNFKVNTEGQLQLMAPAAGTSKIYTKFKKPKDSLELSFYFKMQFAPSDDNNAIVYLLMDTPDEKTGTGYYLTIGENGSNDAIKIWKTSQGVATQLGSGSMSAMATDPAEVRLKIRILGDGSWTIASDYSGGTNFEDDIMLVDNISFLPDSIYFGISAKYTSSRADKFFLDDITIKTIERDLIAPKLATVDVINAQSIRLTFDEPIDPQIAANLSNYIVNNNVGNPSSLTLDGLQSVILSFATPLKSGIEYSVTATGVKDKAGNTNPTSSTFSFSIPPSRGDLIITELLTDPFTGGEDYVEIYNRSEKTIQLKGLLITNITKNESKAITSEATIQPGQYLCISKNIQFLQSTYNTPSEANFLQEVIPSMNVSDAYIGLVQDGIRIDSFRYTQTMHFDLIDETKGVSMERIDLNGASNIDDNWHSASSTVDFGTPGYENSQNQQANGSTVKNSIVLDKKVITPDNDGENDFAYLSYDLDKSGYLATVKVFDAEGYPLFDLGNNELLGQKGNIKWDGLSATGERLRMGIYVIHTRLFHPDGDILEFKNVVAIADRN